jgi:hypothetical protein
MVIETTLHVHTTAAADGTKTTRSQRGLSVRTSLRAGDIFKLTAEKAEAHGENIK